MSRQPLIVLAALPENNIINSENVIFDALSSCQNKMALIDKQPSFLACN